MIKGSHNSLTGYTLLGWQRLFAIVINFFSKCQSSSLQEQLSKGIKIFDIQIAYKSMGLYGSHGIAWYDVNPITQLEELENYALSNHVSISILLGLDNHLAQNSSDSIEGEAQFQYYVTNFNKYFPHLTLVRAYIEKPWKIIYEDKEVVNNMFEKYWSLSWAKSMMKHWWQFYYYLPVPRLWKHIYGKQWDKEAEESGRRFYVTDFV